MNKQTAVISAGLVLGLSILVLAHDEKKDQSTASPARATSREFEQLKGLVGSWKGTEAPSAMNKKPGPVSTEFKLTAAGSAIEETLMQGTPHEMVDMYNDEDGKLAMTHYCAMGNRPHMVLKQAGPTQIALEMGPTHGIDPSKDPHMHALTLEFPDANHLTERWTSYQNGKPGDQVVFTLVRVQ